jgi:F0F1-type ATP synthase membrane subunit b/b'
MREESRKIACKAYEEADKLAKDAWERIKKAHKEEEKEALEEAVKDFSNAMELVYKAWPNVVEELRLQVDTPAMETAYLAGYSEATKGYGLTVDLGVKRGDHVATRTLYKVSRIWP